MKKKITAFLFSLLCLIGAIGDFSAFAGSLDGYYGFIGVHPNGDYVIIEITADVTSPAEKICSIYHLRSTMMNKLFGSAENYPAIGDAVKISYGSFVCTESMAMNTATFMGNVSASVVGSMADSSEVEIFTRTINAITNSDGINWDYEMVAYDYSGYSTGDFPNISNAGIGDQLLMVTYEEKPLFCVDILPLGDVNADGDLDILDVILLNKAVLIGAPIPALETDTGTAKLAKSGETDLGQCDFNGNGTLDLDDSLGMLKRIIGIEETE